MNPFDRTDQDLPEAFASRFASPNELLAPDEDLRSFTWPVTPVPTAVAVDEVANDLDPQDRTDLIDRLNDVAALWIRRSEWDALDITPVDVTEQ